MVTRNTAQRAGIALMTLVLAVGVAAAPVGATADRGGHRHVEAEKKPKAKKAKKKAVAKALPADACALLTTAEVQAVVPAGLQLNPPEGTSGGGSVSCEWSYEGSATIPGGGVSVQVIKLAGMAGTIARGSIEQQIADGESEKVTGVGDVAGLTTVGDVDATVEAIVGGLQLTVGLNAMGAPAKASQVVDLARAAAGRL